MCTTATACTSDNDCPEGPEAAKGACVRVTGTSEAFCTYYVEDADVECIGGGWSFHGTSAFTPVGATAPGKKYVCLPASYGCGDGDCGLFSESLSRCPIDCLYRSCVPNGWEEPGSSCHRADYSSCIDVGRPDGGLVDAGDADPRRTGICVGSREETCGADGGCLPRGGFAGVCVSGLSFKQTCMQRCTQSTDCLPAQRCVPSPTPSVSVCLPGGSPF